jgi:hypothetical protein
MHLEKFRVRGVNAQELERQTMQWQPGTRITLTPEQAESHTQMPGYLLLHGIVVSLGTASGEASTQQQRPAVIEIEKTGRWFVSAHVVVWQPPDS